MRAERQVLFWVTAAALLILTIAVLKEILLPFIAGIAIAYFLSPLADRLVALGLNRIVASLLIVATLAVLVIAGLVLVVPVILTQAQDLAAALPGEIARIREVVETWARERLGPGFSNGLNGQIDKASDALTQNWASLAGWAATSIWSRSLAIVNFLALLLVTPLVVFYLLIDWHPMLEKVDGWLPRGHAASIRTLASDMNDAVAAFVRGQGTVCLILGAYYAVALSLIGLNYGLLIGLATGLMAFVPFVGWALGFITATAVAVIQFWPEMVPILLVIGVFLAAQAIDAGFLSPTIVGSKIGLHPVWLIFALFVFSYLFGIVGTLVAVPLAAALGVVIRFALDVYLKSPVYQGAPSAVTSPGTQP
ncbi:AI-2E family transporter [Hyphomicrobium sp.]|uniref:AI-2E family transporter n=1 Tax=Hyphomicrobium sp. TaxID=82 RepID=UPI0025B7FEA2|nr:AI-2E family transporter [Hyphomicrobium sp.]MCC7253393.1 AI-2E family transporter [Hyphomicrobium sp.]